MHRGKATEGHGKKVAICKPRRPKLPTPLSWTSSLQNCRKIKVCCLSHPDCDICYGSPSKPMPPSFLTEPLHSWTPSCSWNMTVHFTGFVWRGDVMEEGSSPTFSGSVPCFRRFYCNFLSMDLIVYCHHSAGCQSQLDNAQLGKQIWPDLQRWPGEGLIFFARIFLVSASNVHVGHLQEYKK